MTTLTKRTLMLAATLCLALLSPAAAQGLRPMQVEGASGLDVRVLTRWGAPLVQQAGGAGGAVQAPFSHFYVFDKASAGGKTWLKVGPNRSRPPTGWLAEETTVPWRQAVSLSFNQVPQRTPVMFFDKRGPLEAILTDPRRSERITQLIQDVRANGQPANSGMIAMEPQPLADFRSSFYLLPILGIDDVRVPGVRRQGGTKIVQVASLALPPNTESDEVPQQVLNEFRTGVVFVIDTTVSMQKYIDRTRKTVNGIVEHIRRSAIGDRVSFALIGFRDSLEGRPETADDYVTRIFHPLQTNFDPGAFAKALGSMNEARASNVGFAEDGMAGIQAAMGLEGWTNFQGRFIIHITDAPMREANDPRSATKVSIADAAAAAGTPDRPIAIIPILLKTPEGAQYHPASEQQLGDLSYFRALDRKLLLTVPDGNLVQFGAGIDRMVDDVIQMAEMARHGAAANTVQRPAGAAPSPILDAGYVMQLAWLGNHRNVRAPTVVEGWAADFDPVGTAARRSFDINVLLTRNQLNELYQALGVIARTATARLDAAGGSRPFMAQLLHLLATAQTDPATMQSLDPNLATQVPNPAQIRTLGDLVSGYVRALPYRSALLTQPPDALDQASKQQIAELLTDIQSKREMYRDFYRNHDRWTLLNREAGFEEAVYPIPLELLP